MGYFVYYVLKYTGSHSQRVQLQRSLSRFLCIKLINCNVKTFGYNEHPLITNSFFCILLFVVRGEKRFNDLRAWGELNIQILRYYISAKIPPSLITHWKMAQNGHSTSTNPDLHQLKNTPTSVASFRWVTYECIRVFRKLMSTITCPYLQ